MTHNPLMSRERVIVPPRKPPTKAEKIAAWNRDRSLAHILRMIEYDTNGGCWLWRGELIGARYGRTDLLGRGIWTLAHRLSWRVFFGDIAEGLVICHRCDVPQCCNPAHLFAGTMKENMADMRRKGRDRPVRGTAVSNAKLSEVDVGEIVAGLRAGARNVDLGRRYGVTKEAISAIKRGINWRHLTGGAVQ